MSDSPFSVLAHLDSTPYLAPNDGSMSTPLVLDVAERRILEFGMSPLLAGEVLLLRFLGSRPRSWHSAESLSVHVYDRKDRGGRQLVWKYSSTLRQKLAGFAPALIECCRRRGYSCRVPIAVRDIAVLDAVPELTSE
jgi:DNA-binding response OmpR family regulator